MPDRDSDLVVDRERALDLVIDTARDALNQEFARAERLDAKARSQIAMAGAWFGTVQAVAGIVIRDKATDVAWLVAVAALALLASAALLTSFVRLNSVWRIAPQPAISDETLEDMADAAGKPHFRQQTVLLHRNLLRHAQDQNDLRGDALEAAGPWLLATHVFALTELVSALVATTIHSG